MVKEAHTPSFTVEADLAGPATRVVLQGELDFPAASALEGMLALVLGKPPRDIVLEMGGVTFIDCACARVIAQAAQALLGPGRLVIQSPKPAVRRLFHLTGLDAAIPMNEPACPAPAADSGAPTGLTLAGLAIAIQVQG
jgi:anti-sigma B factor antagonist